MGGGNAQDAFKAGGFMKRLLFVLVFILLGICGYAQSVMIRPDASVGFFNAGDKHGVSFSYGGKVILMANDFQRYGVLVNHLVLSEDSYLTVGVFLEQVVFHYFNMGIGTVGYIGLKNDENPFGIYTHLGFEYPVAARFYFLAAYQSEMIFGPSLIMNNALMLGIGIGF
jgi:hypothetical protein